MVDVVKLSDIERMLGEHLQQREQIADLLRRQIEARKQELPMLEAMLTSIESCSAPQSTIESIREACEHAIGSET